MGSSGTTKPQFELVQKVASGPDVEMMKGLVREVPIASRSGIRTQLVLSTRDRTARRPEMVKRFVRYGSSPRVPGSGPGREGRP
jgi:hypothetical protein